MIAKIFAWCMVVLNILMVIYSLLEIQDMQLWTVSVFVAETYIAVKYLEGLK